jgi:PAS domain S-box-containing protein
MITEWSAGAERLYGYSVDQAVGLSAEAVLFDRMTRAQFADLLQRVRESGAVKESEAQRRRDGTRIHADVELRAFHELDVRGFTVAVHNIARRREWEAYREAAARAQGALQQAADDARNQLAALEHLIDPSLNPVGDVDAVAELLERLRSTLTADGAALVPVGRVGRYVTAPGGLQAGGLRPVRPESQMATPGRVTLIHNDPRRVEQASALRWSGDVTSLMVVPVMYNGEVWSTIELVNERPRRAGDWDVALMRITADRLAAAVVQERALAVKVS